MGRERAGSRRGRGAARRTQSASHVGSSIERQRGAAVHQGQGRGEGRWVELEGRVRVEGGAWDALKRQGMRRDR